MSGSGDAARCPWCGAIAAEVAVHGHAQCQKCGANTQPCCGGASADEATAEGTHEASPFPGLFPRLFLRLGGPEATVADEALLHAIVQSQDCDLDEARLVLEAGERIGLIVPAGSGCHRLRGER